MQLPEHLNGRIRALPPQRVQQLVRPIGLECMALVLKLRLPEDVRGACEYAQQLLADPESTEEAFREAARATYATYADADVDIGDVDVGVGVEVAYVAHAVIEAAIYNANVAYTVNAAIYAADAAGYGAHQKDIDLFITRLMLLVG